MGKYRYIIQVAMIVTLLFIQSSNTILASEPNWPQFRGPGSLGIAPDNQTYPTKLDKSQNLLWKTEVPKGHSSPCIWGDNIFITASFSKILETICIDRRNGGIKWRKSVEPEKLEEIHASNSYASSTPVCDGKRLYVYFGSFGLLAYDVDGNEVWKKPLAIPKIVHGSASSPVLTNDMVVINCDSEEGSYILAVDRDTGNMAWRQDRQVERAVWSTPVVWKHGNQEELVVFGSHKLISYDLKDGQKHWWLYNLPNTQAATSPVYSEDTLFIAAAVGMSGDPINPIELPNFKEILEMYDSDKDNRLIQAEIPEDMALIYRMGPEYTGIKNRFSELDSDHNGALSEPEWNKIVENIKNVSPTQMDALVAIRAGGEGDISQSHVLWRAYEGIGQVPSPLFYQGRIYLVKHAGIVTCYDAKTGNKIYGDRVGPRVYYFASPVAADNKIYFCSSNGIIIVVQAGDEFKILAQNRIEERIYATPALVDGKIYLRTDKNMYAFFTKDDSGQKKPDIVVRKTDSQAKTLYEAAADGNIELAQSLIAGGADVNTPNDWGWTPLYVAVAVGHGDVVDLLIAKGADINIKNNNGLTPLLLAATNGQTNILEMLVTKGADIEAKDNNGRTSLHLAAINGQSDIVEMLITKGGDIEAKNNNGRTPLHLAALNGQVNVIKMLLDKGANIKAKNNGGQTPLHFAARDGYKDVVELLIEKGADIKAKNNRVQTPLNLAAINGQVDIAEMLLAKGADSADFIVQDNRGRTPLGLAKENGNTEMVELISKHTNQSGDNKEIMTVYDYVALGDIEKVKSLILEGINVNAKTQIGATALFWASDKGYREIAELLIQNGADVNVQIRSGQTPLILACQNGHRDVVELLLSKGADTNVKNNAGRTPIRIAVNQGHTEIVELLKKHGAKE